MSYQFNRIRITIKGIQEHINSRNKVWEYPMNQKFIALQDLNYELTCMNYDPELPTELVNDVIFNCRDYIVKIHFFNEFYIVESSTNPSEIFTEFFVHEEQADEAFEYAENDCISVYKSFENKYPITGLNLYASKYHYTGQEQEPHEMISKAVLLDQFKIQEVDGSLLMSKNPLIF